MEELSRGMSGLSSAESTPSKIFQSSKASSSDVCPKKLCLLRKGKFHAKTRLFYKRVVRLQVCFLSRCLTFFVFEISTPIVLHKIRNSRRLCLQTSLSLN